MPPAAAVTLNGAYVAGQVARPDRRRRNSAPGRTGKICPGVRSLSFSIATMLPIFGAMLPSAAGGIAADLRPRLRQRMHQRVRLHGAHDREIAVRQILRQLRHQAGGEQQRR